MRGWGPIRKLLVERELKWLHNAAGKKRSHSLLLFLPESLQNLINSKPRLLSFFFFFYLKVSLILNTQTLVFSTTETVSSFDVNGKPGLG